MKLYLPHIIGKGYSEFWFCTLRYLAIVGSRGCKKSTTAALRFIYNMMLFWNVYKLRPELLVMRRYFNTHQGSTYNQLRWAIHRLGVGHLWRAYKTPLKLVYRPSGQSIYFRGLDDPESITSITSDIGNLCWVWWEEAFQVTDENAFNMVDLSIRGKLPEPLFHQHVFTLNPWSEKHWIKPRFFDSPDQNTLALVRTYHCNEFLSESDIALFEDMRVNNPRRYAIEGLGQWGISEGLIFEKWEEREFDFEALRRQTRYRPELRAIYGLDFGFTNHPTAFVACIIDVNARQLFIGYEIYATGMLNSDIFKAIDRLGFSQERIMADSAEPKSIEELKRLGLHSIKGAKKAPGSVNAGIQLLQDYQITVHPRCANVIVELSNYVWAKERLSGRFLNTPIDDFNHAMDALRYASEGIHRRGFTWD